ncbi:MAG: HDOD domain-containing protein [Actinomycetota bacterium]
MRTTDVIEELKQLPMRPSAVTQVLTVLDDPGASARDVASALQTDPALCARLLHLANSPYFGLSGKVGNIERAVVALGAATVRSLAVSTAAGMFGTATEMPEGFWRHSVSVAAGASIAARFAHIPPGDALCAGLMHDLGAALLFRLDTDGYSARLARHLPPADCIADEAAVYGGDHAMVGAFALDAWKLPAEIVTAIRGHHADPTTVEDRLTQVVIAGEALAQGSAHDLHRHEPACDPGAAFAALGLTAVAIDNLVQRTAEEAEALDAVLSSVR